jgi:hypothetical protein
MPRTLNPGPSQGTLLGGSTPSRTLESIECEHLAGWMVRNGCPKPTVTKAWLDAARRLREIDGRTHDQIMAAIDWCQKDEFWQANIHSMPKLRTKYDTLRMQAARARNGRSREARQSRAADLMEELVADQRRGAA